GTLNGWWRDARHDDTQAAYRNESADHARQITDGAVCQVIDHTKRFDAGAEERTGRDDLILGGHAQPELSRRVVRGPALRIPRDAVAVEKTCLWSQDRLLFLRLLPRALDLNRLPIEKLCFEPPAVDD